MDFSLCIDKSAESFEIDVLHLNEVNLQVHCAESAPVLFYLTCVWHSDHMFPVTLTL